MTQSIRSDRPFPSEAFAVVRAPIDQSTGQPFASCTYALFPGITLAQSEPELVVLLYDSILHQYPDAGMFLCGDPQMIPDLWESLGKPTVILALPEDRALFSDRYIDIPTVSLYELLLEHNVSGGCNRELYRLSEPETYGFKESLVELADMMGVVLCEDQPAPFLTSSMDVRNAMKKRGFDAVHILELIYGMGRSNRHLAHTHGEHHDHDAAPQLRDTSMSPEEQEAQEALFDPAAQEQNLQSLHDSLLSFFWGE